MFVGGYIAGMIIGLLVGALIGSLIGALFVKLAGRWVCRFSIPYGMAFKACFILAIIQFVLSLAANVLTTRGEMNPMLIMVLNWVIGFLIAAGVYGFLITDTASKAIGFVKGCLVNLVLLAISIFLGCIILLALIPVFQNMDIATSTHVEYTTSSVNTTASPNPGSTEEPADTQTAMELVSTEPSDVEVASSESVEEFIQSFPKLPVGIVAIVLLVLFIYLEIRSKKPALPPISEDQQEQQQY